MGKFKRIYEQRGELKSNMFWLYEQNKGVYGYIFVFFIISLLSMLFSLASPVASKYVVDAVIGDTKKFEFKYALIMLSASIISILLSAFSNVFSSYVNEKFAFNVRARMFDKTQRGSWKDITAYHSGDMLARLTSDIDNVASNIISMVPSLVITMIKLAIILVILLKNDPTIALIGLIVGPIGMILAILFRRPYKNCQRILRESQSEYYTFFQETLGNLDVVKAFQLENKNNEYFESFRARRMKTVLKSARLSTLMSSVMRLIYGIGYVVAFCWCASQMGTHPGYTYGTMTLFLSLVSQLQGSVRGLGTIIPTFYSVLVSSKRIREITEQFPEEETGKTDIPASVGLSVKNVSFSYNSKVILNNICAEIAPCEKVAVIGTSGAGKTTLIRLMMALVSPDEGTLSYLFDGEEEAISPCSRRLISYVPQGNTLMTGTVRENLLTGNEYADDESMWNALELAGAADFIRRDERGLDMPIKEKSGGVSAGQAQRICIARALMRDRPVLILDEATSALDEATEQRIFETLSKDKSRTYFIITHRSSMLKYCTSVIKIDDEGNLSYIKY